MSMDDTHNKDADNHGRARALRLVSIFGLFCAVPLAIGVFFYAKRTEEDAFDTQYREFARKVLEVIGSTFENSFGALDNLAVAVVASARAQNQTFPLFRVDDFSIWAAKTLSLSRAKVLVTCPVVKDENYVDWVNWTAQEGDAWVHEALGVMKTDQNFYGPIVEEWHPLFHMYTNQGEVPRENGKVYLPSWQAYPIIPSWPPYNFDYIAGLPYSTAHTEMLEKGNIVLTNPYLNPDPNNPDEVETAKIYAAWMYDRLHPDEEPLEPASDLYFPIRDNVKSVYTKSDSFPPVAAFAVSFYWRDMIRDILPETASGILVVVENPCSASFTYRLDGRTPTLLGRGDLHDVRYDGWKTASRMADLSTFRIRQSTYTGPPLDHEHCPITLKIYPSSATEDSYRTLQPIIYSLFTFGLCLCAGFVFLLYDRVQARMQKAVLERVKYSDDMMSSLFPEGVRSRVCERHQSGGGYSGPQIAELYSHTTVSFADIVGFTAWSSTRDASDVFTLLETIYFEFDALARQFGVFKVETVGDAYVAVCGLPEPNEQHAVVMAQFCDACRRKATSIVKDLATLLGPGTEKLKIRYGLNSGPTTAGVLRCDRSRYQVFGDTANVAARMESSSKPNRIQCSRKTADLLIAAGKKAWVTKRMHTVKAKGKGYMETYWVEPCDDELVPHGSAVDVTESSFADQDFAIPREHVHQLINFNVEVLENLLQDLIAHNHASGKIGRWPKVTESVAAFKDVNPRDQLLELIPIPKVAATKGAKKAPLPPVVSQQLRQFVTVVAQRHTNSNPFHNFHHATHVAMSVRKLLARILKPLRHNKGNKMDLILQSTYALTSDPMIQFAVYFSALIHDAEHPGVSNGTLTKEGDDRAVKFEHKSSAEQNSIVVAWDIFMSSDYKDLRSAMFYDCKQLERFRQLIVNAVMATDIFDGELKSFRERRWQKAFQDESSSVDSATFSARTQDIEGGLRATIVIEYIIQASDVVHTMQHWTVYQHWNQRLFAEMRTAYKAGRTEKDPAEGWYKGELWFFDNYVIPLAKKLKECGVFGVSCDEVLDYARDNRLEWEQKGKGIVNEWLDQEESEDAELMGKERQQHGVLLSC